MAVRLNAIPGRSALNGLAALAGLALWGAALRADASRNLKLEKGPPCGRLTAVIVSDQQRLAVLDGVPRRPGESILVEGAAWTLETISTNGISLRRRTGEPLVVASPNAGTSGVERRNVP